ncbi:unnamed protein product, partial [Rotaria sp. Silwood2]
SDAHYQILVQVLKSKKVYTTCEKSPQFVSEFEYTEIYAVKLINEVGEIESSMQLTITKKPIEVGNKYLVDTIDLEKVWIKFECVFATPIEHVKWIKNGSESSNKPSFIYKGEPNQRYL